MTQARDYVVIGGGLAGREAVKALRKQDDGASILLLCGEAHLPYDRPPLTKEYLQGKKTRAEVIYDPPAWYADNRIEASLGVAATELNASAHTIALADRRAVTYGKALIATGGRPVTLPIPGADLKGVHYLRTLDDCEVIRAAASDGGTAIIVGAGFIGLELAASLTKLGAKVHVMEMADHIWPRFANAELAQVFQDYCTARGVTFHCRDRVAEIVGRGHVSSVKTASGKELAADFVCIGVGIRPNVELAQRAGLKVENGIVVDAELRTSDPDIYAAGDVCNFPDAFSGKRRRVEHWSHANLSGRIAGMNMAGAAKPYEFFPFVWSDIFDLSLKFVGDEEGHDATVVRGQPASGSFSIFYLAAGKLTACFAVNGEPREFSLIRRLIQARTALNGRESVLRDPQGDLKSLL